MIFGKPGTGKSTDLVLDVEGRVAPDGYAAAKCLVCELGLDLRITIHSRSGNPVAAEQKRGLLSKL